MSLAIMTFQDLLHILDTHPEWRRRLVKVLFPEVDLPKALQELSEQGKRTEAAIEQLTKIVSRLDERTERLEAGQERLDTRTARLETRTVRLEEGQKRLDARTSRLEKGQQKLDARTSRLETDMSEVKRDLAELKGNFHEMSYRDKAASIFGRYVRRGRDMTNEIADQLHEAQEAGQITARAFAKVLAADLLWGGRLRQAKGKVILVIEASWQAEVSDVERAINRAEILHTIGLRALPVVAGRQWADDATEAAQERGVVTTINGYVDENSWEKALSAHSVT